ncbi:ATP-binding cassette domain-containing protein [Nocardiopsis sp. RSe5-2]|uniref:ATP-binding cassette domain-containing protein n=1 Tax=Nocardiopsis endophytica TaxID=3018445 RepID=A0ABT4U3D7_9ACTN|nr:ATP-binding cassette domain-containing protein [Nocardiopsis endophytica]MDA2810852.1 ATP-binding cassette domain-containing protein [Nocardiopsis endophytica]
MRRATGVRVVAEDVELRTGEGTVFSGVGLEAAPGSLTAVAGDSGSGRTALLLALAGRMRPTGGRLAVDGHPLPRRARKVRDIAALGLSQGVNDLDERLRVAEHLTERMLLRFRPAPKSAVAPALEEAGLGDLDTHTLAKDLTGLERLRLGVALALLEEPRLLLVDDADDGLTDEHRREFWGTLRALADTGLTVVAACGDPAGADEDTAVVRLRRPPRPERTGPKRRTGPARKRALHLSELFARKGA